MENKLIEINLFEYFHFLHQDLLKVEENRIYSFFPAGEITTISMNWFYLVTTGWEAL